MIYSPHRSAHLLRHSVLVLSLLALSIPASVGAAADSTGIHAQATFKDETIKLVVDSFRNSGVCQQLHGRSVQITGPLDKLGVYRFDDYFSQDGAFVAQYQEGYIFKPTSVCDGEVIPFTKIKLFHNKTLELYEFNSGSKRAAWKKRTLPKLELQEFAAKSFEKMAMDGGTQQTHTGKSVYASFTCDLYTLKPPGNSGSLSSCVWTPVPRDNVQYPASLVLYHAMIDKDGKLLNSKTVDTLRLKAAIPTRIFQPPADASFDKPR